MADERQLTRSMFMILLDKNKGVGTPEWIQLKYSEQATRNFNPQEETRAYIFQDNDSTTITGYQQELPIDTRLIEGDEVFDFLYAEWVRKTPIGVDNRCPVGVTYHSDATGIPGDVWYNAEISITALDSAGDSLTASLKLNGDATAGHFDATGGSLTFTPEA